MNHVSQRLQDELTNLRLHARHTGDHFSPAEMRTYLDKQPLLNEADVRQAQARGIADRKAGMRCLCMRCRLDVEKLDTNEALRVMYRKKRDEELTAMGIADSQERARQIDREIDEGAALHQGRTSQ